MKSWFDPVLSIAKTDPERVAFIENGTSVSYEDILLLSYRYSRYLKDLGLKEGERVVIISCRSYRFFAFYAACLINGLVFVPLEERISKTRVAYYQSRLGKSYFVDNFESLPLEEDSLSISEIIETIHIESEKTAQILFTSGSTGEPKGVVSSNLFFTNLPSEKEGFSSSTGMLVTTPINHFGALYLTFATLKHGGRVSYLQSAFDFDSFFLGFERDKLNSVFLTPTILKVYLEMGGEDFAALPIRHAYAAGEYCSPSLRKDFLTLFNHPLTSFYGSTECGLLAVNKGDAKEESLGYVFEGKEISIIDGEIAVKSPFLFKNYVNNEEIDGFFKTGDYGSFENNTLFYKGRKDDIVNIGGNKISLLEIENMAISHPFIKDALCLKKEDEDLAPSITIFYCGSLGKEDAKKFLSENLEQYKVPNDYIRLDGFRLTSSGKKDVAYYKRSLTNLRGDPFH